MAGESAHSGGFWTCRNLSVWGNPAEPNQQTAAVKSGFLRTTWNQNRISPWVQVHTSCQILQSIMGIKPKPKTILRKRRNIFFLILPGDDVSLWPRPSAPPLGVNWHCSRFPESTRWTAVPWTELIKMQRIITLMLIIPLSSVSVESYLRFLMMSSWWMTSYHVIKDRKFNLTNKTNFLLLCPLSKAPWLKQLEPPAQTGVSL